MNLRTMEPNHCTHATSDGTLLFIPALVSGAPGAHRSTP